MSRTARVVVPGYFYHITHRANHKQTIFKSDSDRRHYLFRFEEGRQKYGMRVFAYCIMGNHVHFIAMADHSQSFAKTIGTVHTQYAMYYNWQNALAGHVWQGRYYSCLLGAAHLLRAIRYVERNPVRAKIVEKPWLWVWSSARAHLNLDKSIIQLEDASKILSISNWRNYIDEEDSEQDLTEIRMNTQSGKCWADDGFKAKFENQFGINVDLRPKGRPSKT